MRRTPRNERGASRHAQEFRDEQMSRDVQNTPRMWHRVTIKAENPWLYSTATRGFLVYAYILQKNRAEPHASHATFEGLFEQNQKLNGMGARAQASSAPDRKGAFTQEPRTSLEVPIRDSTSRTSAAVDVRRASQSTFAIRPSRHFPMRRNQRLPVPATEISLCAALTQAHASNCDGDNRDYERP